MHDRWELGDLSINHNSLYRGRDSKTFYLDVTTRDYNGYYDDGTLAQLDSDEVSNCSLDDVMINMNQHDYAHVQAQVAGRFDSASVQHQTYRPGIQVEEQSIVMGGEEGPKPPEDDQSNVIRENSETQADDQSNVMGHEAEIPSDRSRMMGHEEEPSVDDQSNMMGEEEEPAARLDTSKCYADKGTQTEPIVTLFSTGPGWYENLLRLSREAAGQAGTAAARTGYHAFESSSTPIVKQKIREDVISQGFYGIGENKLVKRRNSL